MTKAKRRSKYNASRVERDGLVFDSKAEAHYYLILKEKKKRGEILDFKCQVPFEIVEGYRDYETGRKVRPTVYVADFVVTYPDGTEDVIDVKGSRGFMTDMFRLKKKLFELRYKRPLKIVIMNGKL